MTIHRFNMYLPEELRYKIWNLFNPIKWITCSNCNTDLLHLETHKRIHYNSKWCFYENVLFVDGISVKDCIKKIDSHVSKNNINLVGSSGTLKETTNLYDTIFHVDSGSYFRNNYDTYSQCLPYFLISSNYFCAYCYLKNKKLKNVIRTWRNQSKV